MLPESTCHADHAGMYVRTHARTHAQTNALNFLRSNKWNNWADTQKGAGMNILSNGPLKNGSGAIGTLLELFFVQKTDLKKPTFLSKCFEILSFTLGLTASNQPRRLVVVGFEILTSGYKSPTTTVLTTRFERKMS